jgi:hypothetical protein
MIGLAAGAAGGLVLVIVIVLVVLFCRREREHSDYSPPLELELPMTDNGSIAATTLAGHQFENPLVDSVPGTLATAYAE